MFTTMFKQILQLPRRLINFGGFAFCAGVLCFAYYLQFYKGLEPCPLCILQRVAYIATGLIFLIAAIHNARRIMSRIYAVLIAAAGLTGAGIAARHVWIQHLPPDQVPECGPGLDYMLEVFPLSQALKMAFTGSGECAEVVWTFLGLSVPEWSLLCFLGLAGAGLLWNWRSDS